MLILNLVRWLFAASLALTLTPATAASLADLAADAETDAVTEALVRNRLAQDDLAPYHRLQVSVREGTATLNGTVRTRSTLEAVLREVGKVAGVDRVQHRVKVEPNP